MMGSALSLTLLSSTSHDGAVDEWVYRFPALQELDEQVVWFRPMMNTIAKRLLSEAGWGLEFRVYSGAFLSTMDMISDIVMIVQFFEEGNKFYARAVLASIVANFVLQGILAVRKGGMDCFCNWCVSLFEVPHTPFLRALTLSSPLLLILLLISSSSVCPKQPKICLDYLFRDLGCRPLRQARHRRC